jgi:N-acetylmuramoyl-L-alanine amidase
VQTIVIDPGHGGEEEGARGPDGLLEKDVNLAIAKRIKRQLQGSFRILLTREDDRTLSLAERSRFANEAEADLFVSIHANGHTQRRFHGIETYVLAVDAPRYGPRLRHREALHAATVGSDADPALRQDLRVLLADLAMRGATAQSRMLAERVQARLVNRLRDSYDDVVDLGVKSALFYVLLGTRMPSILVETGFLTHPEEGARLGTRKYRRQVAVAVAEAIREHVGHREMWAERAATGAYVALP